MTMVAGPSYDAATMSMDAAVIINPGGSNVASYWCNRRETSEIQAKAYSRHSCAHA